MKIDFTPKFYRTWAIAAGAAITIGTGVYKGEQAKKQAKKLAANRPVLEKSPYLDEQIGLAESELANGVSARSEQMYNNSTDRAVSSQLNALLQGGGSVNNVSELFDATDAGRQRFAMMNDNIRLSQINNLARAQIGSEGFRQTQFEFNKFRPYADQSQSISQARQGASQMVNNGFNTLVGSVARYGENQGWGTGQNSNNGSPDNDGYVSGSNYTPQPAGGVGAQFPTAPNTPPNLNLNYNNTYGYTPWQNRPQ